MKIIHEDTTHDSRLYRSNFKNLIGRSNDPDFYDLEILSTTTTLVSQKPTRRMITLTPSRDELISGRSFNFKYYLSFPNVLFSIRWAQLTHQKYGLHYLRFAFTNESNSVLFYPAMHNIRTNLTVCTGQKNLVCSSKEELIRSTIDSFWTYSFNADITSCLYYYSRCPIFSCYANWQAYTKQNSSWSPSDEQLVPVHSSFAHIGEYRKDYDISRDEMPLP